jgi:MraZ protein
VFRGLHNINIDAKGRLAVPTRYRQQIKDESAGKLIITIDTEQQCLLLYTQNEWSVIEAKLVALPSFNQQARRIQRLLIGHATDAELDNSGRVLLPAALRQYAQLNKKTVLIGQGNKFEIWNDAFWQTQRDTWLQQPVIHSHDLPDDLQQLSL